MRGLARASTTSRISTSKAWMPGIKPGMTVRETQCFRVMTGLVPAIHVFGAGRL